VIGWIDDLLLVPLGLLAVRAMIPKEVLEEVPRAGRTSSARRDVEVQARVLVAVVALRGADRDEHVEDVERLQGVADAGAARACGERLRRDVLLAA
jgi:hypothetical protein